ncbi:hypothetical protein H4S14_004318 [Agrobacterium vitis]|nr:hypothetical protein [Agrobacterium vitis]MBE1440538.1 hypothetical protein [Agrobacterium vitis]
MTYIAQSPARICSPRHTHMLRPLQAAFLQGYSAFKVWRQQRQLLKSLEAMPEAMRKDLGWPAIQTEQAPCITRR